MTMEPNKMEEDFRKKLNARELQPSEAAWDRLDAMLSVAENKKPKRSFRWLYVAASMVLFSGVGLLLMHQERSNQTLPMNTNDNVVVEGKAIKEAEAVSEPVNGNVSPIFEEHNNAEMVAEHQSNTSTPVREKQKGTNSRLPGASIDKEPVLQETPRVILENTHQEPEKMLAVNEAPKEKPKVKVNANSLLSSVEGELNMEFRETTLDKIKKNFKTVKTAVANRNYE